MKRQVLKEDVGKFGKLIAGEKEFRKAMFGNILYVDHFGAVAFVDNDDILHKFNRLQVESFEEQEFVNKTK